jgi:hypothetical protein
MPASTMPETLVFFALESVSAALYSPSAKPNCSNHASAQRLSASKSDLTPFTGPLFMLVRQPAARSQ